MAVPAGSVRRRTQRIVAFDQDVAEVDAYAIDDAAGLQNTDVALDHQLLNRDSAFDRGDHRRKFEQQPVAHRLDDPAPEPRHDWPGRLAMLAHRFRRPRLVLAHQARVADDVDGHDRGEAAGRGHCSGTPAIRRPSQLRSI